MSYRRQKRWWNAYILFYEQVNEILPTVEDKTIIKTMQDLTICKCRGYSIYKCTVFDVSGFRMVTVDSIAELH